MLATLATRDGAALFVSGLAVGMTYTWMRNRAREYYGGGDDDDDDEDDSEDDSEEEDEAAAKRLKTAPRRSKTAGLPTTRF